MKNYSDYTSLAKKELENIYKDNLFVLKENIDKSLHTVAQSLIMIDMIEQLKNVVEEKIVVEKEKPATTTKASK